MRSADGATEHHALRLDSLTKRYGDVTAVDQVSLVINRGQFFSLLGPSGSGKTTILMMIAGFVEPTEGMVWLGGRVITHLLPERRNFGMVFQGYALFPGFAQKTPPDPAGRRDRKFSTALVRADRHFSLGLLRIDHARALVQLRTNLE